MSLQTIVDNQEQFLITRLVFSSLKKSYLLFSRIHFKLNMDRSCLFEL